MQPLFLGSALLVNLIAATGVLAFYTAPNIEIVVRAKMMEVCQQMCNKTCEPLNYDCASSCQRGCQYYHYQYLVNRAYAKGARHPNVHPNCVKSCRSAYEEHAAAQLSVCLASCDRVDTIYRKSEALGMHIPTAHIVAVYRSQGGGGPPSSSGGTSSGGGNRNSDLVLVRRAEFAEATDARNPDWMRLIGASTGRSSGFLQPGSSAGGYEENAPTTNVVVMSIWRLFDAIWVYVVFSCVVVLLMCYCMFSMFMMERKGKIRKLLPAAKVEAVA